MNWIAPLFVDLIIFHGSSAPMADRAMTIVPRTHDARMRAADLAEEFHLPLQHADETLAPGGARLLVEEDAIELEVAGFGRPLRVNFTSPRLAYRLRSGGREQLLHACGVPRIAGVSLLRGGWHGSPARREAVRSAAIPCVNKLIRATPLA